MNRDAAGMKTTTQLLVGVSVVAADQLSKLATRHTGCATRLCAVRNDALMLGIGHGPTLQVLLIGLTGLIVFCLWARTIRRRAELPDLAVVLAVAGIVGNLIDRVLLGSVRDFFVIPGDVAINLADVALTVGLLLCVAPAGRSVTLLFRNNHRGGETR
jgi:signal peptidase II